MDIFENPFYILGATPRDNRQRIVELAEERSLVLDPDVCNKARADLLHPRKRIAAEVGWLPGISPDRVKSLIRLAEDSNADGIDELSIPDLAKANLIAAGLNRKDQVDTADVIEWSMMLAWVNEDVVAQSVLSDLNNDRVASGFPEVTDVSAVEEELGRIREHFKHILTESLNSLESQELVRVVTSVVEKMTDGGSKRAPTLIDDLVEYYEVSAQEFLEREKANIEAIIAKVRSALMSSEPESLVQSHVTQLISTVKNWDLVAQPIQVSTKGRGLDHPESLSIAGLIRNLALDIVKDYGKIELAKRLTNMMEEVFAEVVKVADIASDDSKELEYIDRELKRAKVKEEQWKNDLKYEVGIGGIIKNTFSISANGISWKGNHWKLEDITRIRWGGTRHSVYGIPSGTTFNIGIGNDNNYKSFEFSGKEIYINIIERLWNAVGSRLMYEYLEGLRSGKYYYFGDVKLTDNGMELEQYKIFSSNERIFCDWNELIIWNGAGTFCIGAKNDKKIAAELSYQNIDNIHVLEAMIRAFWKRGGSRISSLLDGY